MKVFVALLGESWLFSITLHEGGEVQSTFIENFT